jgi:hypothetical protein
MKGDEIQERLFPMVTGLTLRLLEARLLAMTPTFASTDAGDLLKNSALYREFLAEREEILRHKWIESEKAGRDIGFEKALLDWMIKHRSTWRQARIASKK